MNIKRSQPLHNILDGAQHVLTFACESETHLRCCQQHVPSPSQARRRVILSSHLVATQRVDRMHECLFRADNRCAASTR
jgi:hypothetical protein